MRTFQRLAMRRTGRRGLPVPDRQDTPRGVAIRPPTKPAGDPIETYRELEGEPIYGRLLEEHCTLKRFYSFATA
ncbi:hypothetical protein SBADM41S_01468 [Streptomyces badius]